MEIIQLHWHDHPEKTPTWYKRQCERDSPETIAREQDINYDKSARGVVYGGFKDEHILRGVWTPSKELPVIRTLDYGNTCVCLFSQKDAYGNIVFFHEIVLSTEDEKNPTGLLGQMGQAYSNNLKCAGFKDYDDPAGTSDNFNNKEETSYKIITQYGFSPTHNVSGASASRLRNRIDFTREMLSRFPNGNPVIRVTESCVYLIDALRSGYRFKENKQTKEFLDIVDEQHPHEDLADCFGITLVEEFTIGKQLSIPKRPSRRGNRYTGY